MTVDHPASQAAGSARSPSANDLSRRRFLQVGAAAGGGLMLSISLPLANGDAEAADSFAPNAFIRIGGDGQIVLTMPYVEMGQGTYTAIPMLLAEELELDLQQVRLEDAPPNEKLYGNPLLGGIQATGNSNAIRASWPYLILLPVAGSNTSPPCARHAAASMFQRFAAAAISMALAVAPAWRSGFQAPRIAFELPVACTPSSGLA